MSFARGKVIAIFHLDPVAPLIDYITTLLREIWNITIGAYRVESYPKMCKHSNTFVLIVPNVL